MPFRPSFCLFLLGLASFAPLKAGVLLTMAPGAARPRCQPGEFLELAATSTEEEAQQAVTWTVGRFDLFRQYQGTQAVPPPSALGEGRFRFVAPVSGPSGFYLLQARCGEAVSAPLTLKVFTPDGLAQGALGTAASAPGPALPAVVDEAKDAGAPAGAFPLSRLPSDLLAHMASFTPRTFGPVNRQWRELVRLGKSHLDATDPSLTDLDLVSRVLTYPNATSIAFGEHQPKLTPAGVAYALSLNLKLEALDTGGTVHGPHLATLATTHPQLTRLKLGKHHLLPFMDHHVQRFKDRMTHLEIEDSRQTVRFLTPAAIQGATKLERLTLDHVQGTWEHLPDSLRSLEVLDCDAFTGQGLPKGLINLKVWGCRTFMPTQLPPTLQTLTLNTIQATTSDHLLELVRPLTQLRFLSTTVAVGDGFVQALPRTLRVLDLGSGSCLVKPSFTHLVHLEELQIFGAAGFDGRAVPEGLQVLTVEACAGFQAENVAPAVRQHLVELGIYDCPLAPQEGLRETLATFPDLRTFMFRHGFAHLEAAPLAEGHPRLRKITLLYHAPRHTALPYLVRQYWTRPATATLDSEGKAPAQQEGDHGAQPVGLPTKL